MANQQSEKPLKTSRAGIVAQRSRGCPGAGAGAPAFRLLAHLGAGDEEEAASQQQPLQRSLEVAELDALQVQDALAVGQDEGVERQDLEHLQCGHQCASALLDHVANCGGRQGGRGGQAAWAEGWGSGMSKQQDSLHWMEESLEVKGAAMLASPSFTMGVLSSSRSRST